MERPARVAITGIGVISPRGIGAEAVKEALAQGTPPWAAPEGPDAPAAPAPEVASVPAEFKPNRYVTRRKDLKLMARANRLAVAAARMAVESAGLNDQPDLWREAGLFMGVGREPGTLKDLLPALARSRVPGVQAVDLDRLVDEGMRWMNPLSALKTLPNMSVAHVAINLGIMGPDYALCAEAQAGCSALVEAVWALHAGRAPLALAGAADARISLPDRLTAARQIAVGERDEAPLGEGAALWVLEPEGNARARGASVLGWLTLGSGHEAPPAELDCGAATEVLALTEALLEGRSISRLGVQIEPVTSAPVASASAPAIHVQRPDPVAITGVGLETPLGRDFEGFTRRLLAGETGGRRIAAFPCDRFPVQVACEVPDWSVDRLPGPLQEAMASLEDRKGELSLGAALAAVADHGGLPANAAVTWGTGLSSLTVRELAQDYLPHLDATGHLDYAALGQAAPPSDRRQSPWRHLVGRPMALLRAHLGLSGVHACHFSACAAGAAAVAHAADLIRRGEAEVALAGGGDSMVHPFGLIPFILLGAVTEVADPDEAGRPFDQRRSGFVMGEGAAFYVLEPLSRARAAGRHVYGLVQGAGTSVDAWNVTAPHPEGAGAERAMRAALADARWSPGQVDYINAHGTGTPLNDAIESAAIARLFGDPGPAVSSSKAQLGHTIAAAGALELAACLAAFRGGRLPPNPHTEQVDPRVTVDLVEPGGRAVAPSAILSNSFGFGGQNACLALQHVEAL